MKLVFPHKEHKDFELIGNSFTIGSSEDASIQIEAIGMAAIHATLIQDGEEYSLKIDNPACMASVNGRLVKDSREVREGDLMIVAQVHCKIESKKAEQQDDNRTRIRMALPKFILRGVSGVYFGKTFPLRGKTSLGRHSDNDIFVNVDGVSRKHSVISVTVDGLEIEDMDSSNGTYVNGKNIAEPTKINIGDEIKLDNVRFLIQSPGVQMDNNQIQKNKAAMTSGKTNIPNSAQETSAALSGSIGANSTGKWVAVVVILIIAAGVGAWSMGLLDKFL